MAKASYKFCFNCDTSDSRSTYPASCMPRGRNQTFKNSWNSSVQGISVSSCFRQVDFLSTLNVPSLTQVFFCVLYSAWTSFKAASSHDLIWKLRWRKRKTIGFEAAAKKARFAISFGINVSMLTRKFVAKTLIGKPFGCWKAVKVVCIPLKTAG